MKRFAAIQKTGLVAYTLTLSEDSYKSGDILGDEYMLIETPNYISDIELINNFYWNDGWLNKPPKPSQYYYWDANTFSWNPNLSDAQEDKKNLLNKKRDEVLRISNNPLIYNGNEFTNDSKTRFNISEALNLVNAGVPIPEGFMFRTADNINIPFNAEDIKNLAALSLFYKNACYQHSWELKNQIDTLTTVEEIEAFDINVGWP
jgi:hypothetical protein